MKIRNITLNSFLYISTVWACDNKAWWLTMYGSVLEFPTRQLPFGGEHRPGACSPEKYPAPAKLWISLKVIQCFTLAPHRSKQNRAYLVNASLDYMFIKMHWISVIRNTHVFLFKLLRIQIKHEEFLNETRLTMR